MQSSAGRLSERDDVANLEYFGHISATNPVLGLADSQNKCYDTTLAKIAKIRECQRDIFLLQFKQFADEDNNNLESYSSVWESFKVKGQQVDSLVNKLDSLNRHIDRVNKDTRHANQ